jgi:hypothetical protein
MRRWIVAVGVVVSLSSCTTPYEPPVVVPGAPDFQGVADLLDSTRPLEVVLVHGMCTHDAKWAQTAMDEIVRAIDANLKPAPPQAQVAGVGPGPKIEIVQREDTIGGSKVRFTGIVWSPLTTPLKQQLAYDRTGNTTDCSVVGECKPKRAKANAYLKDWLLNDCLADALVYEGVSRPVIRRAMAQVLLDVLQNSNGPVVLVTDSLGSKVAFDALMELLEGATPTDASTQPGAKVSARVAQVFMNANQMPILGLADQNVSQPPAALVSGATPAVDALQRYARMRAQTLTPQLARLMVVAFTDPNDLLSYRLMPSRYATDNVAIADVLVSNDKTYFGLLERPDTAHMSYDQNRAVARFIACGKPTSSRCR